MSLSRVVSEIFYSLSINVETLKLGSKVTQDHWKILYTGYGLLSVFYRNFVPNMYRFWGNRLQ